MKNQKGFTLIELLVAVALIAVVMTGLFAAFQSGLAAFARSENYLTRDREQEVFFLQLNQELRNAVPFSAHPFQGNPNSIRFPAKLTRYTAKGSEEGLFLVEYEIKNGVLTRKESRLKKESLKEQTGAPEVLFESVNVRFDFLQAPGGGSPAWGGEWMNKPYTGLPRGVRVELQGKVSGAAKSVHQILIPHGFIEKRL